MFLGFGTEAIAHHRPSYTTTSATDTTFDETVIHHTIDRHTPSTVIHHAIDRHAPRLGDRHRGGREKHSGECGRRQRRRGKK